MTRSDFFFLFHSDVITSKHLCKYRPICIFTYFKKKKKVKFKDHNIKLNKTLICYFYKYTIQKYIPNLK